MRDKTPKQRYFRPILQALVDLGGRAPIESVFQRVYELMSDQLTAVDLTELPSGGLRWKKTLNFAKMHLADHLLLESDGQKWWITQRGREYLRSGQASPVTTASTDDALRCFRQHRDKVVELIKKWFEREHGRNSVKATTVETALKQLFSN